MDHITTTADRETVAYLTRLRNMVDEVLAVAAASATDVEVTDDEGTPVQVAIDMLLDDVHEDDPESPAHAMTEAEFAALVDFIRGGQA